jgi:hypothetical protein
MVSVFVTGPKVRGFKPAGGNKNPQHSFLGSGVKTLTPCRKILRHVKELYAYEVDIS